jgi:RND family efflux transporter MFP subunit
MKKYISLLAISLVLISCGSDTKDVAKNNTASIPVTVSAVNSENNNQFFTVSGKIEAANQIQLSTRSSGFIDHIYVNVGDKVKKGKLLLSINNSDLQAKRAQINATIGQAQAAFNSAERDYNRFKQLFSDQSASQKEMDDMTVNFEMAKAGLEAANQMKNEINSQFKYVEIRAPFDGVITNKFMEAGDLANPGMPLIALESPGDFEVSLWVPESQISQIKTGTKVDVLVKSMNQTIKGTVTEVSTSAYNTGGQYQVKIALDKTDYQILSGMYTTVKFPSEKKSTTNTVLIPTSVIIKNGQLSGIYTVSQSQTALLRWLRLGKTYGDKVEVLSGLNSEEQYIVSAEGKLYNGVKVTIQ